MDCSINNQNREVHGVEGSVDKRSHTTDNRLP
jgi:hypothetical protein